jgi:hypothetical protein
MKVSNREFILFWITALIVLMAITLWFCSPKINAWKELNEIRKTMQKRIELDERVVSQRQQWHKRLQDVAQRLSKYPADQDVTADCLRILETLVKENSVTISSRTPQKEKRHKELYELAIICQWEADLNSLIKFLHAVSQQKTTMDIGDLSVTVVEGGKGKLKGSFSLVCLYTRQGVPSGAAKEASPANVKKR